MPAGIRNCVYTSNFNGGTPGSCCFFVQLAAFLGVLPLSFLQLGLVGVFTFLPVGDE
jgi:hypothetical protein